LEPEAVLKKNIDRFEKRSSIAALIVNNPRRAPEVCPQRPFKRRGAKGRQAKKEPFLLSPGGAEKEQGTIMAQGREDGSISAGWGR